VASIGGRYSLVYDRYSNALALVDLAEGRVTQVTGASARLGSFEYSLTPLLRTAGRFVLLAGWDGWERFELVGGRLEPAGARLADPWSESYEGVDLAPDGKVVALGWSVSFGYFLETVAVDGCSARVPRTGSRLLQLSLSPAGDLLSLAMPEFWEPSTLDVWDVSNPSAPVVLWNGPPDVAEAHFDPTGTRLLVSGPLYGDTFSVRAYDARTGAPTCEPSRPVYKFSYHGLGAQWMTEGAWRAVYWNWTWGGWGNALLDLTGSPPEVVKVYDYGGAFPEFTARDGGGWYEVRRDPWKYRAKLVVGTHDFETAETEVVPADHEGLSALRRGFAATHRIHAGGHGMSLWRDAALNRPPVVAATGGGRLECTGPEGATARLDGSSSFDPDSAPGTQDDLASFAWSVDGAGLGASATTEAVVSLGSHQARLEVTDVLGASTAAGLAISVEDGVAPSGRVSFEPVVEGGVFRGIRAEGVAEDVCDPAPIAATRLRIPAEAIGAPVSWKRSDVAAVEIRATARGAAIVLLGPSETHAKQAWTDALGSGGHELASSSLLRLGGPSRDLMWRISLSGPIVVEAAAYGGRDLVVGVDAADASGNAASAESSLLDAICDALPAGATCAGN
jgi:hypothetical protein